MCCLWPVPLVSRCHPGTEVLSTLHINSKANNVSLNKIDGGGDGALIKLGIGDSYLDFLFVILEVSTGGEGQ